MTLLDLNNPKKLVSLFHLKKQVWIEPSKDQGFQEWPGSIELWQDMGDGRLARVCRWLKKSVYGYSIDENCPW